MRPLLRDIRYAFRALRKSPGLTFVAVIALTFGIGLTGTMFSIVYGALMKGLPFRDGDRVVQVLRNNPSRNISRMSVPIADYVDYRDGQHSLESLAAYYGQGFLANALPKRDDIEAEPKTDVTASLTHATKNTKTKGEYHKTRHGFDLLGSIDAEKVCKRSRHAPAV